MTANSIYSRIVNQNLAQELLDIRHMMIRTLTQGFCNEYFSIHLPNARDLWDIEYNDR